MRSVLVVVLVFAATAKAQPELPPELAPLPAELAPAPTRPLPRKTPTGALARSLAGTAMGMTMIWIGAKGNDTPFMVIGGAIAVAGPSWGEWWVEDRLEITPGFALRGLGVTVMGVGFGTAVDHACATRDCNPPLRTMMSDRVIEIGAAIAIAGIAYDIIDAPRRAALLPVATPDSAGIAAVGSF